MSDRDLPARIHARLLETFGPLHWWPGDGAFEIVVGAVLTQNTAWTRVVPAIANLKAAGVLRPRAMNDLAEDRLAELIRPAGTFRVKASYLKGLVAWLVLSFDGDLDRALSGDTGARRKELLSQKGIGRETADSILLYAGGHPVFVVDAYTRRIFSRHGLVPPRADYDEIRAWFETRLPPDPAVLNELHAQIVTVGKDFCRPRKPKCDTCPLRFLGEPYLS